MFCIIFLLIYTILRNISCLHFLLYIIIWNEVTSDSGYSPWSDWQCTVTCGGGYGRKTRKCINPGPNRCQSRRYHYGRCNEQPCPVVPKPLSNKGWTPWMPWECPVSCGGGIGTRSRICEDPDICEGPEEEKGTCAEQPCPVDSDAVNEELQRQIEQQLKTSRHNFVVQKGEQFLIPCKDRLAVLLDREHPNAKVSWVHNGQMVKADNQRIKLENGGDLKVKAVSTDNGLWWCSVALSSKASVTISFAAVGVQNDEPDIVVEQGEPFEIKCLAKSLGRLVKSRMDQTWIHNSTTFRQLNDVKPENTEKLKISSSKFSDSGIWNCRYSESSSNREWVTNVVRILVIPPRTLLQKILPIVITITVCLIVLVVVGKLYWNRSKKKKLDFEDEDGKDEYKYSKGNEYKRTNENEYKYSIADPYKYGEENEYKYAEESGIDEDELTPLFAENLRGYNNR